MILVMVFILAILVVQTMGYRLYLNKALGRITDRLASVRIEMIEQIPKDSSVLASHVFLPKLSNRNDLYSIFMLMQNRVYLTNSKFEPRKSIDYVLLDFSEPLLRVNLSKHPQYYADIFKNYFEHNSLVPVRSVEDVYLFKRSDNDHIQLDGVLERNRPSICENGLVDLDEKLMLCSYRASGGSGIIHMEFYWDVFRDPRSTIALQFCLLKNNKVVYSKRRDVGFELYPVSGWKKGELIKDAYNYYVDDLESGDYDIEVTFFNMNSKSYSVIKNLKSTLTADNGRIFFGHVRVNSNQEYIFSGN